MSAVVIDEAKCLTCHELATVSPVARHPGMVLCECPKCLVKIRVTVEGTKPVRSVFFSIKAHVVTDQADESSESPSVLRTVSTAKVTLTPIRARKMPVGAMAYQP